MKKILSIALIISFLVTATPISAIARNNGGQGVDTAWESGPGIKYIRPDHEVQAPVFEKEQVPGEFETPEAQSVNGQVYNESEDYPAEITEDSPLVELTVRKNSLIQDYQSDYNAVCDVLKEHNRFDLLEKMQQESEPSVTENVYKNHFFSIKKHNREQLRPVTGEVNKKQDKSVIDDVYEKQDGSVIDEVYGNTGNELQAMSVAATGEETKDILNTLTGPSVTNGVNNQKYSAWSDMEEIISPETGDLTFKQTDINLPGRNGLDLSIGRVYQSNQAMYGDRKATGYNGNYNDYTTYYLNRYGLGVGWAFDFPSVQIEISGSKKEMYYHTGDGSVYHLDDNYDGTYDLENYYKKDVIFREDTTYTNGQVTSKYALENADKTTSYFGADGRYLGVKDRFGNNIVFKHEERPGMNIAPNYDFDLTEDSVEWLEYGTTDQYSYTNGFGMGDNTSLKYGNFYPDVYAFTCSRAISVDPETKYFFDGYVYNDLKSTQNPGPMVFCREYDQYGNELNNVAHLDSSMKPSRTWNYLSDSFVTSPQARYVRIFIWAIDASGDSALGLCYFDKIKLQRVCPMISQITDSIGRKVTFTYNDTMYDESATNAGSVTIKVSEPVPNPATDVTMTYKRSLVKLNYWWKNTANNFGGWNEQRRFPLLYSYTSGENYNTYSYYQFPDDDFDYYSKTFYTSSDLSVSSMLKEINFRNSKVHYDYEEVEKQLGEKGYYTTHRVNRRYEQYLDANNTYQGKEQLKNYTYSGYYNGVTYDNETGYHVNGSSIDSYDGIYGVEKTDYQFTSKMQQSDGLSIEQTFSRERIASSVKNNSGGEVERQSYTYGNALFPRFPTMVTTEETSSGGTNTLYQGYTYNSWGGVASETHPLTPDQWNDSTVKKQHTINYTYDPDYKFLTSKKYYQNESKLLTETTTYDSSGRVATTTNAKGETTNFFYEDPNHPGNLTREEVNHSDGRKSTTVIAYDTSCFAYPAAITQYYTENGVQKTSTTRQNYEYLRGNVTRSEDAMGNITTYTYDSMGRPDKATYPVSTGKDGTYVIEEDNDYNKSVAVTEAGNRKLFELVQYKRKIPTGGSAVNIGETRSYYGDNGNLLLSKYWDYDRQVWVPATYTYDSYGKLTGVKDALNNQTGYQIDEWGRLKRVTNAQGNYHQFVYDTFNRTKTTYFVNASTGASENNYTETYDQWGNTISRKGYPDGVGGAAIEEKYEYDFLGNCTKFTDPNNRETLFKYDQLSRLVKVTNPLGEQADYDYDRLGDLAGIKQYQGAKTFTTTKLYDERGNLVSKKLPAGNTTTYKYNAAGLPVEVTDPSGTAAAMQYYPDSRLKQATKGSETIKYYYSPLGMAEKIEAPAGSDTLNYEFYSNGLTKKRTVASYNAQFQYDILGNRTRVTDPFGLNTDYVYDSLNRMKTVTADGKTFTYEYYPDGMIKAVNYPSGTNIRAEYTYDNANRLKKLKNLVNGQAAMVYSYGYDKNGNIISITENGSTTNYQYDELNRLTGITRPDGTKTGYKYDTRGNRVITTGKETGPENFIPGDLTYDPWDRLSTYTTGGNTYSYKYDPEGLRTQKTDSSGSTRYHCDNNGMVIAESGAAGQITAQIIRGRQALARKVGGVYYYYLYNGHGDVVGIVDGGGNIVNSYFYDEWGNILSKTEQVANPIRYAGEYYDDESGLYYLRARYYDPTVGRFISRDSYEGEITNPLSLNLYAYVENNPLIYIDPTGHFLADDWNPDGSFKYPVHYNDIEYCGYKWNKATNQKDKDYWHQLAEFYRGRGEHPDTLKDPPILKDPFTYVGGLGGIVKTAASRVISKAVAKIVTKMVAKEAVTEGAGKALTSFDDVAGYIAKNGRLPGNFITKAEARGLGWNPSKGNLADVAPGKSIGGDIFKNIEGKLPSAPGRVFYEADINYSSGFRGTERIIYSNDGLIYKTVDHYQTFTQIY
ncbi:MAG: RHS repeat-associated core domain-containing protein [Bacillota bacterium]